MTTVLLPVKVEGSHITFVATVDGEVFEQTFTVTDRITGPLLNEKGETVVNAHGDTVLVTTGATARNATKADIALYKDEFGALLTEREKSVPSDPKKPRDTADYYDQAGTKLTKKQAVDAFKAVFPDEGVAP